MKIAVVGTGYVGLVTGTCFAERNNEVVCIDIDDEKVAKMRKGIVPIYEPGLEEIFKKNIKEGRLSFTTGLKEGLKDVEVVFLALPTPQGADGSADLSFVLKAVADIAPLLERYTIIVDKSTVPVGTAEKVEKVIAEKTKISFDVVSNPEFLKEGFAVKDFMYPDRVVIGASSKKVAKIIKDLYKPFVKDDNQIILMDIRSAEMTKYASNAFLATKITFMNEIANLCEKLGANVDEVRVGVGSDPRIGSRFLYSGIGYGGSCFPKDVEALAKTAKDIGYEPEILNAVNSVNSKQKKTLVNKARKYFKDDLSGKHFALWGLAFKPDTDDIREAPALDMINDLIAAGATVAAYDPQAEDNVRKFFNNKVLELGDDKYSVLNGADALLIATEWKEFREAEVNKINKLLKKPVVFDGRNIFNPQDFTQFDFYSSIGRRSVGTKNV